MIYLKGAWNSLPENLDEHLGAPQGWGPRTALWLGASPRWLGDWGRWQGQCERDGIRQQIRQVPRWATDAGEGPCLCGNGAMKRLTCGPEDVEKYLHGVLGWPLCPAVPGASLGFLQFVRCPAMALREFQRGVICYTEQLMIWQVFLWTLSLHYSDTGSTGCWLEFTLQGRMAPICLCILL